MPDIHSGSFVGGRRGFVVRSVGAAAILTFRCSSRFGFPVCDAEEQRTAILGPRGHAVGDDPLILWKRMIGRRVVCALSFLRAAEAGPCQEDFRRPVMLVVRPGTEYCKIGGVFPPCEIRIDRWRRVEHA